MPQPLAVVVSDLHVDDHAWAHRPEIRGDSQFAFERVCRYAAAKQLPIIAAGDLIDKKINRASPIGFLRRQFDFLAKHHVPFLFIQGQHELQPEPWVQEIHRHPVWLQAQPDGYQLNGVRIAGIDWSPADVLPSRLEQVPADCQVLVLHQVMEEFMGGIAVPEASFAQIPHASLLIVGDYHEHRLERSRGLQGQPLTVLSPGSTNMRKIDEPPEKRFFVLFDDLSTKSVRLRSRPYLEKRLFLEPDVDSFVEEIAAELAAVRQTAAADGLPEALQTPLVRVIYESGLPDVYRRVTAAVGDAGHLFTKEHVSSRPTPVADDDADAVRAAEFRQRFTQHGLLGCLPLALSEADEPGAFAVCRRLLGDQDVAGSLAALRREYFHEDTA